MERGPNIKPLPEFDPLPDNLSTRVGIIVGDNISTDGIMPAGAAILPLRSNIEAISNYVFSQIDQDFPARGPESVGGSGHWRGKITARDLPGSMRPCPALFRGAGQDRQEFRPDPQSQPMQFRHPAPDLRQSG